MLTIACRDLAIVEAPATLSHHHKASEMETIKLFRIIGVGAASPANWFIGRPGR
jgi:hypothetical protein